VSQVRILPGALDLRRRIGFCVSQCAVSPRIERVEPVLNVRDVPAAMRFYAQLGFVERFRDDPDTPKFVLVSRDDAMLALQWHDFDGIAGDRPTLRFPVDDVDGLSKEFGSLRDRTAVSDTPWGTREFHVRDPDGNGLQFYRDL
jgi:catechol 2,3-dioxygenase-like lactoylglutathione lyase family enzyme